MSYSLFRDYSAMTTTDSKDQELLASPDKAMPGHSPIRIGAPVDISDGLRSSLVSLQRETLASHPTGSQTQRTEIYSTLQARYVDCLCTVLFTFIVRLDISLLCSETSIHSIQNWIRTTA